MSFQKGTHRAGQKGPLQFLKFVVFSLMTGLFSSGMNDWLLHKRNLLILLSLMFALSVPLIAFIRNLYSPTSATTLTEKIITEHSEM